MMMTMMIRVAANIVEESTAEARVMERGVPATVTIRRTYV